MRERERERTEKRRQKETDEIDSVYINCVIVCDCV